MKNPRSDKYVKLCDHVVVMLSTMLMRKDIGDDSDGDAHNAMLQNFQ